MLFKISLKINNIQNFYLENVYNVTGTASSGINLVLVCNYIDYDIVKADSNIMLYCIVVTKILKNEDLVQTIVVLTSFTDRESLDKSLDSVASGYLTKPVKKDNVLTVLETSRNGSL